MNRDYRRKQARELRIRNKQRCKEKKVIQDLFNNLKQRFFVVIKQMM